MKITPLELADFRKGIVAILGAAAEAVNFGLVTGATARWVGIIIGVATAAGVVVVPNSGSTLKPATAATPAPPVMPAAPAPGPAPPTP